jgi:hypothetical protein
MKTIDINKFEATYDNEIREAFHKKKLQTQHNCSSTLIIDELGLLHGSNRIDIAVINGLIHGYEIKSSKDTLKRFETQFDTYRKSLQKITYITAPNHMDALLKVLPEWCGVMLAEKGNRGAIHFFTVRPAKCNPEVDTMTLAHLLWKNEAQELLMELGVNKKKLLGNRASLYEQLAQTLQPNQLIHSITEKFISRKNWRVE